MARMQRAHENGFRNGAVEEQRYEYLSSFIHRRIISEHRHG